VSRVAAVALELQEVPVEGRFGASIVERYKANYGIASETHISPWMIQRHWDLERLLAKEMLDTPSETRTAVFETAYTTLYRELPWLNDSVGEVTQATSIRASQRWGDLLDAASRDVYEVGSGRGELLSFLGEQGHRCTGSEITSERGESRTESSSCIRWHPTDGVHLNWYEPQCAYDFVVSNHVVEHLHPDDLEEHVASARTLLRSGGQYLLCTPHAFAGPADVSRVFGRDRPEGMHLREYEWGEIAAAFSSAGYSRITAIWSPPTAIETLFGVRLRARRSRLYLAYVRGLETLLRPFPPCRLRRILVRWLRFAMFPASIWIAAEK
jgi:SAM-dependent methyltransferase